jgi:hypothetical protein
VPAKIVDWVTELVDVTVDPDVVGWVELEIAVVDQVVIELVVV